MFLLCSFGSFCPHFLQRKPNNKLSAIIFVHVIILVSKYRYSHKYYITLLAGFQTLNIMISCCIFFHYLFLFNSSYSSSYSHFNCCIVFHFMTTSWFIILLMMDTTLFHCFQYFSTMNNSSVNMIVHSFLFTWVDDIIT